MLFQPWDFHVLRSFLNLIFVPPAPNPMWLLRLLKWLSKLTPVIKFLRWVKPQGILTSGGLGTCSLQISVREGGEYSFRGGQVGVWVLGQTILHLAASEKSAHLSEPLCSRSHTLKCSYSKSWRPKFSTKPKDPMVVLTASLKDLLL